MTPAKILGIETSCDETAAAVVEDGARILGSVVASQAGIHRAFGGVVPEVACREHVRAVLPVLSLALEQAAVRPSDLSAVAVTTSPGLIGALLVGASAAGALGTALSVPVVPVNHIEAHLYAPFVAGAPSRYPLVSLIVSGGHTSLFVSRSPTDHAVLGATLDDAAGEAFDKVAVLLGLGYPGGPAVERAALEGDARAHPFRRSLPGRDTFDFSFSGLKTAVLYAAYGQDGRRDGRPMKPGVRIADLAAAFQAAVVDILVTRVRQAVRFTGIRAVAAGGGVACNDALRAGLARAAETDRFELLLTPRELCTDNAAMIAGLGYHVLRGDGGAALEVAARTSWPRFRR